jgi:hypothetical protein
MKSFESLFIAQQKTTELKKANIIMKSAKLPNHSFFVSSWFVDAAYFFSFLYRFL